MLPPYLVEVPGTPYVVLKKDAAFSRWALENKSIIREGQIADLPIVQALTSNDVVLDIGAFIGDTALIFAQKGCDVWAFEPYPDAFTALRWNCRRDVAPYTIHCINAAVGDGRKMKATGEFGENNKNHGTRMCELDVGDTHSLRIDDLNLYRVTFVKIDCEGCEPLVLDGMVETIKRHKPKLLIELYDGLLKKHGFTRESVLSRLAELGYGHEVAIGRMEDERVDILAEYCN